MKQWLKKYEHISFSVLLIVTDMFCIAGGVLCAYYLRFYSLFAVSKGIPLLSDYLIHLFPISIIFVVIFERMGLYKPKIDPFHIGEITELLKGVLAGSFIIMSVTFLFRGFEYSRGVLIILFTILPVVLGFEKVLIRTLQVYLRQRGFLLRNVLIVGIGKKAQDIFEIMSTKVSLGFHPVGFLPTPNEFIRQKFPFRKNVLGTTDKIARIIRKYCVDEVFIALPSSLHQNILEIIMQCEKEVVKFKVLPDMFEILISKVTIQEMEGIPFVTLEDPKLFTWWYFLKRGLDFIGSGGGLILLSPVFLIISILIKLDSKGSVFFTQKRVGLDGKKFYMYKFRTMKIDAEEDTGPVWTSRKDNRCTRIGTLLRKTNLDELPQLLNVLRSDMSLVGPRPERPYFVNKFKNKIPHYMSRHRVKSGITGWAQVNGLRGNSSLEDRIKYDLFYIENWSFMFDIKILLMTFFSHKNAY